MHALSKHSGRGVNVYEKRRERRGECFQASREARFGADEQEPDRIGFSIKELRNYLPVISDIQGGRKIIEKKSN